MVLTAYFVLSPATSSFLSPSLANMVCLNPVGPTRLRQFSTSNGCQDHTALPSALAPFVSALLIAHKSLDPPCHHVARPTLPRPPHPIPTSVTIAIRPSVRDGTARLLELIWVRQEQKYFCREDWTGKSVICPSCSFVGYGGDGRLDGSLRILENGISLHLLRA
jgi:hypothetical protein